MKHHARLDPLALREAREVAGLTRTELAVCVNRSEQTIHAWEAGRRAPKDEAVLIAIADTLAIDPAALMVQI